jgi:hypothetical protein
LFSGEINKAHIRIIIKKGCEDRRLAVATMANRNFDGRKRAVTPVGHGGEGLRRHLCPPGPGREDPFLESGAERLYGWGEAEALGWRRE